MATDHDECIALADKLAAAIEKMGMGEIPDVVGL